MGTALLQPSRWSRERSRRASLLALTGAAFFLAIVLALMPVFSLMVEVIAVPVAIAAAGLILFDPAASLPVLMAFFIALGTVRRSVSYATGSFSSSDPMLIVPPVCVLLALAVAIHRGAFRDRTPISSAMLALNVLAIIAVFNPLQGGVSTGVLGLYYLLLPMLWFWVGRGLVGDSQLAKLLRVTTWFAVPVAVYGLFQTFGTFPAFDTAWANFVGSGYSSIYVGGHLRPFASFASPGEYGTFLAICIIVLSARVLAGKSRLTLRLAAVIGVLGVALFLSSLRAALILTLVGGAIMVAAKRRAGLVRLGVYGGLALVALFLFASRLAGGGGGLSNPAAATGNSALLSHQVSGLSDPLNSKTSTASIHAALIYEAIVQTVHNPIGYGTGASRSNKSTGGTGSGTSSGSSAPPAKPSTRGSTPSSYLHASDSDPGNLAIDWGVAGLAAYLVLAVVGFKRSYALAMHRGDWLSFAVLGILAATLFQWFSDMYAVMPLLWLSFGWLDRTTASKPTATVPALS